VRPLLAGIGQVPARAANAASLRTLPGCDQATMVWAALTGPTRDGLGGLESVARTGRLFTVEENPRLLGWGAEMAAIVGEEAFWDLDGPITRITTPHVPLPSADSLEDMVIPSVERIQAEIERAMQA
jgi:pyruvate dehydrogenase E1 component beta subunit